MVINRENGNISCFLWLFSVLTFSRKGPLFQGSFWLFYSTPLMTPLVTPLMTTLMTPLKPNEHGVWHTCCNQKKPGEQAGARQPCCASVRRGAGGGVEVPGVMGTDPVGTTWHTSGSHHPPLPRAQVLTFSRNIKNLITFSWFFMIFIDFDKTVPRSLLLTGR